MTRQLLLLLLAVVTALFLSILTTLGIVIMWTPPVDENVVGFRIHSGPASRVYTEAVEAGNFPTAMLLTPAVRTYYAVQSLSRFGTESELSAEVNWTPQKAKPVFVWKLPAGRFVIERNPDLLNPLDWTPIETLDGPIEYQVFTDTTVQKNFFRYRPL